MKRCFIYSTIGTVTFQIQDNLYATILTNSWLECDIFSIRRFTKTFKQQVVVVDENIDKEEEEESIRVSETNKEKYEAKVNPAKEEEKETDEYGEEEKAREKEYRRPFGVRPFYLLPRSSSLCNWTKQLPVGAARRSSISFCLSLGLNAAQMMCSNNLN